MHTRNIQYIVLIALLVSSLGLSFVPASPVIAQAGSPSDLIAAVNAYRAANGLEPYSTDGGLMSLAQSHSEYIAQIQNCTHTRADGSGPGDYGISAENVACGLELSVNGAIYSQWADPLHSTTMLGPDTGLVGAGVASNGSTVYYTLAVKRLSGGFEYRPPVQPTADGASSSSAVQPVSQDATQPPPVGSIVTSTPNPDGSVSHKLQYGETLVEIAAAYGVPLPDLISMNKLSPNNPVYYEGDVLLIRLAYTPTPEVTATSTARPATRTPLPTRTPRPTRTATVPHTPAPTMTPSPEPFIQVPTLEDLGPARNVMAYSFIAISVIGLVVLIWSSFWPSKKN